MPAKTNKLVQAKAKINEDNLPLTQNQKIGWNAYRRHLIDSGLYGSPTLNSGGLEKFANWAKENPQYDINPKHLNRILNALEADTKQTREDVHAKRVGFTSDVDKWNSQEVPNKKAAKPAYPGQYMTQLMFPGLILNDNGVRTQYQPSPGTMKSTDYIQKVSPGFGKQKP
jgi:hypothetical protein